MGTGMRQFIYQIFLPAFVFLCLQACGGGLGGSPVNSLDGSAAGGGGGALDSPGAGGSGGGSGANSGGGTTVQYAQPAQGGYQGGYLDEGANPTGNFFHLQNENISLKCKNGDKGNALTFKGTVFPPGIFSIFSKSFSSGRILRVVDAKASQFHDEKLKVELIAKPSWVVDEEDHQMEVGTYNFDLYLSSASGLTFYLLPPGAAGSFGSGFKDCPAEGCVPADSFTIAINVGYRPEQNEFDYVPDCDDPNQAVPIPHVF